MTTVTRLQWATRFLEDGNFVVDYQHQLAVLVRIRGEYGWSPTGAKWNPLDTCLPMPGSWSFNTVGVQNYPSFETGVLASLKTLDEPRYSDLVTILRTVGAQAGLILATWNASGWGKIDYLGLLPDVERDWSTDSTLLVSGSELVGPPPAASTTTVNEAAAGPTKEEEGPLLFIAHAVDGGCWAIRGDKKAGIPNPVAEHALEAQQAKSITLSADELNELTTVAWGSL